MTKMETEIYQISCEIRKNLAEERHLKRKHKRAVADHDALMAKMESDSSIPPAPPYPRTKLKALRRARRKLERQRSRKQRWICAFGDPEKIKPLSAADLMNTWEVLIVAIFIGSVLFDAVSALIIYHGFNLEEFVYAVAKSLITHFVAMAIGLITAFIASIVRVGMDFRIDEYADIEHLFKRGVCQGIYRYYKTTGIKNALCIVMLSVPGGIFILKCESVYYASINNVINNIITHRAAMFLEVMFSVTGAVLTIAKIVIDSSKAREKKQVF